MLLFWPVTPVNVVEIAQPACKKALIQLVCGKLTGPAEIHVVGIVPASLEANGIGSNKTPDGLGTPSNSPLVKLFKRNNCKISA